MSDYESISKAATPRPWHTNDDGPYWVFASSGEAVAKGYGLPPNQTIRAGANAALIVHCVNNYDALLASHKALVEALAHAADEMEKMRDALGQRSLIDLSDDMRLEAEDARAAIAQARSIEP